MTPTPCSSVAFLIDDDEAVRDALSWLLRSRGIPSRDWSSAEAFLTDYSPQMQGCLVVDIRMQGMTGLELFDRLRDLECRLPIIFLTGHGELSKAVQVLKQGAFDFIEKPFNDNELADRVLEAITWDEARRTRGQQSHAIHNRLRSLTSREKEIMARIIKGQMNKIIADELNIAMRTVEAHRSHVFEKMGVKSAVELATLLAENGISVSF
ncbi:MAG: response regulator transcription factor [Betaproteobacteria bacterium]|nr:response regulator transcription factor [Betaproteobacteria bacterium]